MVLVEYDDRNESESLKIKGLVERIGQGEIQEVIVATNPTVEGEATAVYLAAIVFTLLMVFNGSAEVTRLGADETLPDEELPVYTVLVPLTDGTDVRGVVGLLVKVDATAAAAPAAPTAAVSTQDKHAATPRTGLDLLHDVEMEVTAELGRTRMSVRELLSLNPGNVVELDGKLYAVLTAENIHPGKGTPVTQLDLRRISDGVKISERFRTTEQVERAYIEEGEYQYLFDEGASFAFMEESTFDQISVPKDLLGDRAPYLQEGMKVQIRLFQGTPVSIEIPPGCRCRRGPRGARACCPRRGPRGDRRRRGSRGPRGCGSPARARSGSAASCPRPSSAAGRSGSRRRRASRSRAAPR